MACCHRWGWSIWAAAPWFLSARVSWMLIRNSDMCDMLVGRVTTSRYTYCWAKAVYTFWLLLLSRHTRKDCFYLEACFCVQRSCFAEMPKGVRALGLPQWAVYMTSATTAQAYECIRFQSQCSTKFYIFSVCAIGAFRALATFGGTFVDYLSIWSSKLTYP